MRKNKHHKSSTIIITLTNIFKDLSSAFQPCLICISLDAGGISSNISNLAGRAKSWASSLGTTGLYGCALSRLTVLTPPVKHDSDYNNNYNNKILWHCRVTGMDGFYLVRFDRYDDEERWGMSRGTATFLYAIREKPAIVLLSESVTPSSGTERSFRSRPGVNATYFYS